MKSFSKAFGRIVLILTVVIALVASVFVVPKLFGINPYVVLSGSMEPQIHTGAIAFVNTKDTAVKVGDVVTYRLANDELVTHRIIKKDQSEYTFQGDANDNPDAHTVTQDQIVGKYLFSIPKVGFLISALGKKGMPVIIAWIIILNIMSLILESTCWEKGEPAIVYYQNSKPENAFVKNAAWTGRLILGIMQSLVAVAIGIAYYVGTH